MEDLQCPLNSATVHSPEYCPVRQVSTAYSVWKRNVRLFSPRWVVITALSFIFTYLLVPRPSHMIQVEWPLKKDAVGLDRKLDESLIEKLMMEGEGKWANHEHRFKFIFSRKRLNVTERSKVNLIPEHVKWHRDPSHLCRTAQPSPLAVVLVFSAVNHTTRRTFIRNSWAQHSWYPYTHLKTAFVVGATIDHEQQQALDEEGHTHQDLIQYNFIDSYANLTYKSLALLKWGVTRCPEVQFIVKVDDDILLNPFHLRAFLEQTLQRPPSPEGIFPHDELFKAPSDTNVATSYIYGRYDAKPYPLRKTKWRVSKDEYPEKVYPPFVHGPAYMVGRAAAKELLRMSQYVAVVKLEDVYLTGLVAHAAGIRHVQIYGPVTTFKAGPALYNGIQAILEGNNEAERRAVWLEILKFAPNVKNVSDVGLRVLT